MDLFLFILVLFILQCIQDQYCDLKILMPLFDTNFKNLDFFSCEVSRNLCHYAISFHMHAVTKKDNKKVNRSPGSTKIANRSQSPTPRGREK